MRNSKAFWALGIVGALLLSEMSYRLVTSYHKVYYQSQSGIPKMSRCQGNWQETLFFDRVSVCLPPDLRPEVRAYPKWERAFRHSNFWLFFAYGGSNTCAVHKSYQGKKHNPLTELQIAGRLATITIEHSVPIGDLEESLIGDALTLCVPDIGDGREFAFIGKGQKIEVFEQIMSSVKFELKQ